VVKAVGNRATVLFDSGVRSGTDVARALALGASAALAGKAFLWSLGALGSEGPGHAIDLFIDELQSALGQIGAHSPAEAREALIRHPGAYDFGRNHP
jgi:L-lactate dehydrogenase (cytochrome)